MDFLRAMEGYAENEEEKDENVFGVLIAIQFKKLSKKEKLWPKEKSKTSFMTCRWRMKSHKAREIILTPTDQRLIIQTWFLFSPDF